MNEAESRELVEPKELFIDATANWDTPSGKRRTAPIYEAEIANGYLNKHRTVKAKSTDELEAKVRENLREKEQPAASTEETARSEEPAESED